MVKSSSAFHYLQEEEEKMCITKHFFYLMIIWGRIWRLLEKIRRIRTEIASFLSLIRLLWDNKCIIISQNWSEQSQCAAIGRCRQSLVATVNGVCLYCLHTLFCYLIFGLILILLFSYTPELSLICISAKSNIFNYTFLNSSVQFKLANS